MSDDNTARVHAEVIVRFPDGSEMVIPHAVLDEPFGPVAGKIPTWDDVAADPGILHQARQDWRFQIAGTALPRDGERGPTITLTRPHSTQQWFSTLHSDLPVCPTHTPTGKGE